MSSYNRKPFRPRRITYLTQRRNDEDYRDNGGTDPLRTRVYNYSLTWTASKPI